MRRNRDLPRGYTPGTMEEKWYAFWIAKGLFEADIDTDVDGRKRPPFSIVIPPPNVTGSLHMGHAFNNTFQDILCRTRRMQGYDVLWLPGTDHAGIATQNVVEKRLRAKGQSRHSLGREKFLEETWKVKEEHHAIIFEQLARLGASCRLGPGAVYHG